MYTHTLRAHKESEILSKEDQLAWHLASLAAAIPPINDDAKEMVINRIIDNAAVSIAALGRAPVSAAIDQALSFQNPKGSPIVGLCGDFLVDSNWAAWVNGVMARELDMHDTFLAADYSHPADSIPPILAVAASISSKFKINNTDIIRGILTAYEIHISLVKSICLHKFKIDHVAHLAPAMVAGICSMLKLETEVTYQAIGQALHTSIATRQSRKGEISSWKAYAPAHVGKLSIECVDRAMRGQNSPTPIYEGEDSVIAKILEGFNHEYSILLPNKDEPRIQILESYTKEHSAEYQAQAFIDLAFEFKDIEINQIDKIILKSSHHTHNVIGTGSNDPQKFDQNASRETLDHSLMYIFCIALMDQQWHHINSYPPKREIDLNTFNLWQSISSEEDEKWTELYHHEDPNQKAFGGQAIIKFKDGSKITKEKKLANAHPNGKHPFERKDYEKKFTNLTNDKISDAQKDLFFTSLDMLLCNERKVLSKNDILSFNPLADQYTRDELGKTSGLF